MLLHRKNYLDCLERLIGKSEKLDVAVAFWGDGAEQIFQNAPADQQRRLLCNFSMGGTNPFVVERLLTIPNINMRQLDDLHAKVVVGARSAIVGSANISANGLGVGGAETAGWSEAGSFLESVEDVEEVQTWFEEHWAASREISKADLEIAKLRWNANATRSIARGMNPFELPVNELKDLPIYVAVYVDQATQEAQAAWDKRVIEISEQNSISRPAVTSLSFFEDWPSLPDDGSIVCYHFEKDAGYTANEGVWRRVEDFDTSFTDGDGNTKQLQCVMREKSILGYRLTQNSMQKLDETLIPLMNIIHGALHRPQEESFCVSLYDVLKYVEAERLEKEIDVS